MRKQTFILPTLSLWLAAHGAASAATLAPLDAFKTQVVSWAGDIGMIAFVAIVVALVFAHDHMQQMFGSLTRGIIAIALLVTGATWLGSIGIQTAGGAWLR